MFRANMLAVVVFLCCVSGAYSVQCMSSTGKPVDWFIIYKLPELRSNKSNPMLRDGYGHFYMDVLNPSWQLSKMSMNSTNHAVYYTLQAIYESKPTDDFMYLMYNDDDPNDQESLNHGHTKGVVAFDNKTGYWLVHSTPQFPRYKNESYTWPHNALSFGQSFLCVSYSYSQLNAIAKQLFFNYIRLYDHFTPDSFLNNNPDLMSVVKNTRLETPPWSNKVTLSSLAGTKFTSFAKFSNFHADLYEDLVAPSLQSDLMTETWQNSGSRMNSSCAGKFKVYNVKSIVLPEGIVFKETKDHSKWAISQNGTNWVCIGDINRDLSQEKRAGGTVCFQNSKVWTNFNLAVNSIESCPLKGH
ncbi:plancitoxin-1-like isoform X2 [Haliotis rufescens]|uniref:plancitoxin-1-like isoform X1 n=1 Tax=Haliotis rufescens TaxID=6454 RepID=UPI00201EDA00|nr:plancitoxin-1-like isoform X1 [Haliotis rufescens]XP_048245840.1 plancitoxin-1-like isoform X1 [Haliotis rufescens]XP_048245841.1 plancitoxin-1-like isoform X2 [Haliotis rufescens]